VGGALAGGPEDLVMAGHVLLGGSLIGFQKQSKGRHVDHGTGGAKTAAALEGPSDAEALFAT